jgi:hypothetical protein
MTFMNYAVIAPGKRDQPSAEVFMRVRITPV